jgi:hypothetical protein
MNDEIYKDNLNLNLIENELNLNINSIIETDQNNIEINPHKEIHNTLINNNNNNHSLIKRNLLMKKNPLIQLTLEVKIY